MNVSGEAKRHSLAMLIPRIVGWCGSRGVKDAGVLGA